MSIRTAAWWGGGLGDGSVVVFSPTAGVDLLMTDHSSPGGMQPGAGKKGAKTPWQWLVQRSAFGIKYGHGRHVIGVHRVTVLVFVVLFLAGVVNTGRLGSLVKGIDPLGVIGIGLSVVAGCAWGALLCYGVYCVEVLPLKRKGVTFIDVREDNDDYLRYVHPAVQELDAWGTLTDAAKSHTPPSETSQKVHHLLWELAGVKPYIDSGEIKQSDETKIDEIALQAKGL